VLGVDAPRGAGDIRYHVEAVLVAAETITLDRLKRNLIDSRPQTKNTLPPDQISVALANLKGGLAFSGAIHADSDAERADWLAIPDRVRRYV
jgi:hypothetical protein